MLRGDFSNDAWILIELPLELEHRKAWTIEIWDSLLNLTLSTHANFLGPFLKLWFVS